MTIGNPQSGIAHAYDGSMLYRYIQNDGIAFEQLAEELHGPEIEHRLSIGGFQETRQNVDPIYLEPSFGSQSPIYNTLIGKQFDQAFISMTHTVDGFDKSLENYVIALKSSFNTGYAELALQEGGHYIAVAANPEKIATSEPLNIDHDAAIQIVKDILLQSGYDPRDLRESNTLENMLFLLAGRTQQGTIERSTDHTWNDLESDGYKMELNFRQKTKLSAGKIPIRLAELGITAAQSLKVTTEDTSATPFATTRLLFTSGPDGNVGTIQAGLGNITPAQYDLQTRERLLTGTYNQLRRADVFTARLISSLGHLASFDIFDLGVL